jgi:hypothetical protein
MVYYCSYSINNYRSDLEMNLRSPKDKKFNGMSDNKNNRTSTFKLDTAKADLDNDGKLSSYEKTRGMAIQKNMKKA